jgi:parvulin-like peptidyl-prolyl isomerase
LREDIFGAGVGELIGPVKQEQNYLLVEVAKLNPGAVTPLAEVRSGIRRQLTEEARQKKFAEFADSFRRQWRARTVCAPELAIETCSNGPVG